MRPTASASAADGRVMGGRVMGAGRRTRHFGTRARAALCAIATCALLGTACSGASQPLDVPPAEPGSERPDGLPWWSRAAIDAVLRFRVWREDRSGYVAAFAHDGHPVHATALGLADREAGTPMTVDTRVRIASMTKPITAVAALILVEEGRLRLDDPVQRYIPAFASARVATSPRRNADGRFDTLPAEPVPTVRHLLTFAAGVGGGGGGDGEEPSELARHWHEHGLLATPGPLAERVRRLATLPLFEPPGTAWRYGWSADVLARVVEVAAGEPFDAFLERRIFEPLGMDHTGYPPPPGEPNDLAAVYTQTADGSLERVTPRDPVGWTEGGGGLVSTAGDYLRFALMLWNGGAYDGVRILSPETVAQMTRSHVSGVEPMPGFAGLGWGLGVAVVEDAGATPVMDADGDFWWAGVYGTTFLVSPAKGLVGVVLSQDFAGPHSDLPLGLYIAQGIAHAAL